MSGLREEIRAILREEIAALSGTGRAPVTETVQISNGADLTRFARDLLARAADPAFAAAVANGTHRFDLATQGYAIAPARAIIASPAPAAVPEVVAKPLITERDIGEMARDGKVLRIARASRLTPLAQDEARRRGIRIERCAT